MRKFVLFLTVITLAAAPGFAAGKAYPLKTCVVSGDALDGDMGGPVDFEYKGRVYKLCCKSCVKKFKANPEKYVAEYEKQVAKSGRK